MKINEIQELIKFVSKAGVSEVELETKDIKITIKTNGKGSKSENGNGNGNAPLAQPVPSYQVQVPVVAAPAAIEPVSKKTETAADNAKYITIKSPMVGTFYRSPGPDKAAFVNIGDEIKQGKVICIIEAMKLFNEIEAEVSGKIVKFLVDDASPVEYDQPLFLVEPN